MIELQRLGAHGEPVWVNPDLIATMEAHPDTIVVLTNGTKVVVSNSVDDVVDRIRGWRASVARATLKPVDSAPTTLS
ncbi:MAG TPA: flagellar FlbD family protein [Solirubrobacteraceae bacterium]|nr:flagellar FlbD family protein [Solirubrobacteraceae bacterium]